MQEYTLVMSERDTVHKEMDKLQEELSQASKKIKNIEQTTNNTNKEVRECKGMCITSRLYAMLNQNKHPVTSVFFFFHVYIYIYIYI